MGCLLFTHQEIPHWDKKWAHHFMTFRKIFCFRKNAVCYCKNPKGAHNPINVDN